MGEVEVGCDVVACDVVGAAEVVVVVVVPPPQPVAMMTRIQKTENRTHAIFFIFPPRCFSLLSFVCRLPCSWIVPDKSRPPE